MTDIYQSDPSEELFQLVAKTVANQYVMRILEENEAVDRDGYLIWELEVEDHDDLRFAAVNPQAGEIYQLEEIDASPLFSGIRVTDINQIIFIYNDLESFIEELLERNSFPEDFPKEAKYTTPLSQWNFVISSLS